MLNVLDLITTYWSISKGATELNPLSQFLIDTKLLIPTKLILVAGILAGAVKRREVNIAVLCGSWFVTGAYSLVVVLNAITLVKTW